MCLFHTDNRYSLCYTDTCVKKKVPILFICINVLQGPLIPCTHLINIKPASAMKGDVFLHCHFPSPHGVTDAFTPHETPITITVA